MSKIDMKWKNLTILKLDAQEKVRLHKSSIRLQRKKLLVKFPRRQGVVSKDVTHFIASSPVLLGFTYCDHCNHHILKSMVPTRKPTWKQRSHFLLKHVQLMHV